jgi:alkylated DNA repair dioxygenase AlkB
MTNCLANRYPTGDSKMGYHADSYASLAETSRIAIVSLGSTRTISFRRNDPCEVVRALELEPGSLLVMGPSVQESYKHAVLPAPGAGCRVSLTFRYVEP